MKSDRHSGRWLYLDSIRGLAALAVVYFHVIEFLSGSGRIVYPVEAAIASLFTEYVDLGKIAVVLFFAVSGYAVPFSLTRPSSAPLRAFAIGRFFRLYPAYWLSLAVALVVSALVGRQLPSAATVAANLTMVQQMLGQRDVLGVYWTLQIEIVFYFVCATFFALGVLRHPRLPMAASLAFILLSVAVAWARFETGIRLPVALPLGLAVMFWGLGLRSVDQDGDRSSIALHTAVVLVGVLVTTLLAYSTDMGFNETWYRYAVAYWVAMGLFRLLTTKLRITNAVAVRLGGISYSVYLFGAVVQILVVAAVEAVPELGVPAHATALAAMLATVVVSLLTHALVERPFQAFGRTLQKALDAPKREEVAGA